MSELDFTQTPHSLLNRRWTASCHRSAGGVYVLYTGFVAAKPSSRNRSEFRFAMIHQRTHTMVVGVRMYGKANVRVGRLQ